MAALEIVANPTLAEQAIAAVRPVMEKLGEDIVTSMQDHHTYADRTGNLTRSLGFDVDELGHLNVGAGEFYGRFLEEGTSTMPAQPFLLPAILEHAGVVL
jgi:HK97 gp10 family phage protein